MSIDSVVSLSAFEEHSIEDSIVQPIMIGPPRLITDWVDLVGLETDRYRLGINTRWGNGYIYPKFDIEDDYIYFRHNIYLSTHTFYGSRYLGSTKLLNKFGFNVQLENWDAKCQDCESKSMTK